MRSILDPSFEYVDSAKTDVRKTFERVRTRMAEERAAREEAERKAEAERRDHVTPFQLRHRRG